VRILVHYGKHGDEHWLADSSEQLNAAMWRLFTILDEQQCFVEDEVHSFTLRMARTGNAQCVRAILQLHRDYEYEGWELKEVTDPCTD
jgi:hypothetical protein